ncbi:uncharacterized protein LOC103308231 [Acyrthosiphon pisum]|uniref:Integrase catalytic domain-containing protein n=1 Tax=Acyrthosiphon pisum TaxID=7029 RepID=A0A8R2B1Q3_ACYPI|nr:uncharacterized protein LOC103308231 [Acyrthosiphon pisum]|eukprot:XP_008179517.1 PREDICTED: uncharacterized protein LOC103308231 [Acyrthosiphon pisum]
MGVYEEAKARISNLTNRTRRVYDAGEAIKGDSNDTKAKIKFKIMYATLEKLSEDFETQLSTIIRYQCKGAAEPDDKGETEEWQAEFEELYVGCKILADEYLPEAAVESTLNRTFFEQKPPNSTNTYFPVEKLSVPIFRGSPLEYTSFRNMFDILVHESNMSPVLKFGYLKSRLEGEPLKLIGNLMLTASNYELALSQLNARYSNRRIIAESHLDELSKAPNASHDDGDQWDPILLYLLQKKLDQNLRTQWELLVDTTEDPTVLEFVTFLTKYSKSATVCQANDKPATSRGSKLSKTTALFSDRTEQRHTFAPKRTSTNQPEKRTYTCQVCNSHPGHLLIHCPLFREKSPTERYQIIKDLKRCFNCFSAHMASECMNPKKCSECSAKHHTLLHFGDHEQVVTSAHVTVATSSTRDPHASVLLATASVVIQNEEGNHVTVRALLDSASQSSFITERCAHLLQLVRKKCDVMVQALSGTRVPVVKGSANIIIRPVDQEEPQFNVDVLILSRITGPVPSERVWSDNWPHIHGLQLADPEYSETLPIEILLGADVFPHLFLGDKREGTAGQPIAMSTVFGWVLMGKTSSAPDRNIVTMCSTMDAVDRTLQLFLENEDVPTVEKSSQADLECERIYQSTTTRQSDGRYIVHLPFQQDPPLLGKSKDVALRRLEQLENRFKRFPELRDEYHNAMKDYLALGHMSQIKVPSADEPTGAYYIPHQAVLRPESTTTRMRVVFDASAKSSSGLSLNDNLWCGEKLQQELPSIVLRFRLHPVVFTADVKQMFRQIKVTEAHRPYQRLLYRFTQNEPIQEYEMNTVMFGQKSSPFLAIRTLHKLVEDEAANMPTVREVVQHDLYVDDVATGAETEELAMELQKNLVEVFAKGQFEFRKWSSNSEKLLASIPVDHRYTQPVTLIEQESEQTKVLGLNWDPKADVLSYKYQPNPVKYSKRAILSEVARIYDPLGLLSPVTTDLKRLMKYLWLVEVGWDEPIPEEAATAWKKYHQELPVLATLKIPRLVTHTRASYELHGFSDSSEAAYAAAVYIRVTSESQTNCHLLMGKSKIAPASKVSVPRLELCGAWLLARLINYVQQHLEMLKISNVTAWTDSTVALSWIRTPTVRLKTFVANRVAKIQQLTDTKIWRHIPTRDNPADCASRGLGPNDLATHELWWKGPKFLRQPENTWPVEGTRCPDSCPEEEVEQKRITLLTQVVDDECRVLWQSDNLSKVLRLTAYLLRIVDRLRKKTIPHWTSPPTTEETDRALRSLIRWTQQAFFEDAKKAFRADRSGPVHLRRLAPFLDNEDLLRVGGCLEHALIPYTEKHPLLLPKTARLTELLIDHVHRTKGHPGPQTMQNLLLQNYWILSSRSIIKKRVHRCVPCFRAKPRPVQPFMGNLPQFRLNQIKPFSKVGVDFAGPFDVKAAMIRKIKITKAYICIFICLVTTAVHIELVSDLSTPLFIAGLNRFISRRGRCTDIYSDCGTNFVGTHRYLTEVETIIQGADFSNNVLEHQIRWHFNPPSAPHMGGIWEAAVKSTKSLLHRVIQNTVLTYEELNTVLHQVEATLNSRPLSAMSSDPSDYRTLTAGHFLTLEPLVTIPSPQDVADLVTMSSHKRWSLIQQIQYHFWTRWKNEYLHTLQERPKWNRPDKNLQLDDLVIIKEPTPPLKWSTARVIEVHPGDDGIVRVAKVKTSTEKVLTRPAVKLCPMPLRD